MFSLTLHSVTSEADNLKRSLYVYGAEASQPATQKDLYEFAEKFAEIMHTLEQELEKE